MAYTPPTGNLVDLNFIGDYTAPIGDDVQLQFGSVLDNYIRTHSVYLEYLSDTLQVTEAILIDTHAFTLEAAYDTSIVDPLIHINADNVILESLYDHHQLQILPDIVTHDTIYEMDYDSLEVGGNSATDLPKGISPGFNVPWGGRIESDIHFKFPWDDIYAVDQHFLITRARAFPIVDIHFIAIWNAMYITDIPSVNDWASFNWVDLHQSYYWDSMLIRDKEYKARYTDGFLVDEFHLYRYGQPSPFDVQSTYVFEENKTQTDRTYFMPYGIGVDPDSDTFREVPWGPRELFSYCFKNYEPPRPGMSIDLSFPAKYPLYIGATNLVFELSNYSTSPLCNNQHNHTGIRDNNIIPGVDVEPVIPPIPFPIKPVYYIMNTVLVQTLPGHVQVEVKGLSMTIDRESWLWQLNMTVGKKEYVDLLSPKNGTYPTVEIYINGWKWVYLIEGWTENLGFARGTYSITGRSPSMILGDPICDKKTLTVTELGTGSYIMQGIMNSNAAAAGFSIVFSGYDNTQTGFDPATGSDWNIPAHSFSYTEQTDIQAMQMLTNSIGAYIQTNPAFYNYGTGNDGRFLDVFPRYAWQPWNWELTNPELEFKILDKSIIREMGSTYKKNPDYYGAYIVGEAPKEGASVGVFCDVYKQEKGAACKHAPVESSMLYTTDMIAQEKGRMIIAEAGVWCEHTIRVFSLFPEPQLPGLFKVGDLINVRDGATSEWIGLVVSTTIEASVVNGSAFSVSQNLGVTQYVGEWNV